MYLIGIFTKIECEISIIAKKSVILQANWNIVANGMLFISAIFD